MFENKNLNKLIMFLVENGISVTLSTTYNNGKPSSYIWDFDSQAKSHMHVVPVDDNTITIKARYGVDHKFEITENVDDYIEELLYLFKTDIVYYPNRDYYNSAWGELMKQYGVLDV